MLTGILPSIISLGLSITACKNENKYIYAKGAKGRNELLKAINENDSSRSKLLIKKGAGIDTTDNDIETTQIASNALTQSINVVQNSDIILTKDINNYTVSTNTINKNDYSNRTAKAVEDVGGVLVKIGVVTEEKKLLLETGDKTLRIDARGWEHFKTNQE